MTSFGVTPRTRARPSGPGFGARAAFGDLSALPQPMRREGLLLLMEGGLRLNQAALAAGMSVDAAAALLLTSDTVAAVTIEMRFGEVKG